MSVNVVTTPKLGQTVILTPAQFNALRKSWDITISPRGYAMFGDGYATVEPMPKLTDAEESLARRIAYYDIQHDRNMSRIHADVQRECGHNEDADPQPFINAKNADRRYNYADGAATALYEYAQEVMPPAKLHALTIRAAAIEKELQYVS